MPPMNRRQFLHNLGVSAASLPFLSALPSLNGAPEIQKRQRVVIMFSPNGTLPNEFWPDQEGEDFHFKSILEPLEPFKKQTLLLNGVYNKVLGDGDQHMRGMSCLLTGSPLLPGNIMGAAANPRGGPEAFPSTKSSANFVRATRQRARGLDPWSLVWRFQTARIPGPA